LCCSLLQVAPNSDGIQKLLAAEQEASRIVAEARKGVCRQLEQQAAQPAKQQGRSVSVSASAKCMQQLMSILLHQHVPSKRRFLSGLPSACCKASPLFCRPNIWVWDLNWLLPQHYVELCAAPACTCGTRRQPSTCLHHRYTWMPHQIFVLVSVCAGKAERLRQAKAEAEKEISAYRAEREGAYQKKLAEVRLAASAPVATTAHITRSSACCSAS
jgi:hypothetical protein